MPDVMTRTIEVGGELSEVSRVQEELEQLWEAASLPGEIECTVSLALEEVLSNVLRHGGEGSGQGGTLVTFRVLDRGFEFEVSDCGLAYDPLLRPDPDLKAPLEERRPGGLGVFLVKKLADEVSYQRRDGRNNLRFFKKFEGNVSGTAN